LHSINKIKSAIDYQKYINYLIIIYAFSIPLSRALTSISIALLIVLFILDGNFKNKIDEIKSNNFILAIFVFVLYSIIAVLWSSDKGFALGYFIPKYYHFLVIPIILTSLKKEYIEKIFSAFLLAMLISEITSYGIFFELWSKKGISQSDPSPFMSHSNYSIYLAFTIFILLHKMIYSNSIKWRLAYGIFFIFSTSNLFLNGGRTGQVAFLVTLCFVGILSFKNKIKATLAFIFLGVAIVTAAYSISPVFKDRANYLVHDIQKMVYEKDYSNSFSTRVALWMSGLEASKEAPIFGTGIGDEKINAEAGMIKYKIPNIFGNDNTKNYIDFHSAYVQYLVQLGIVGLMLFLSIFYFLIKVKIKKTMYKNLLYLFIVLYILQSSVGLTFHIQKSMIFFVLFSSLFLVIAKYEKEETSANP
jgi:O-antigen ligase